MTDTVVEFINVTGRTYDQLVAGVTVASTTASQQAVVKDVYVNNPNGRSVQLNVGSALVAPLPSSTNARLAGTELLGASSALTISTAVKGLLNSIIYNPQNQSEIYSTNCSTVFSDDKLLSSIQLSPHSATTLSSSLAVQPGFICFANNGDFYYSANGSNSLFRRAGGVNGTQTTITSNGAACSFDGRYIYSFTGGSNSMSVVDTQNNGALTVGAVTNLPNINSSTANSASINGFVFVQPSQSDFVWLVNPTTRVATNLQVLQGSAGVKAYLGVGQNSAGKYVVLRASDTGQYFDTAIIEPSFSNPQVISTGQIVAALPNTYGTVNNLYPVISAPNYLIYFASAGNICYLIDVNQSVATSFSFSSNSGVAVNAAKFLKPSATQTNDDFGLTSIRATGILTT